MKAALFNTPITIDRPVQTQNSYNEPVTSYVRVLSTYAHRTPRPGREFFMAGRTVAAMTQFYVIRHVDGLTNEMRLTDGNRVYDIIDIQYSEKRRDSIQLTCQEVK